VVNGLDPLTVCMQVMARGDRGGSVVSLAESAPGGKLAFMAGVDSGLVVVVTILIFLIVVMMTTFIYVKYEWCHVLFRNNTVT
jgi:hypothetical protein